MPTNRTDPELKGRYLLHVTMDVALSVVGVCEPKNAFLLLHTTNHNTRLHLPNLNSMTNNFRKPSQIHGVFNL